MMISEIESLKAQIELANKALIDIAIQLGFDHFSDDEVAIAIESLLATKASNGVKIEQRDRRIALLESDLGVSDQETQDLGDRVNCPTTLTSRLEIEKREVEAQIRIAEKTIGDRDRTIEILQENLDRAKADHLEQLRAIAQMLEPLATHEDKGSLYLTHFGKAAMVYLIQKVVSANIEKLDPKRSAYSNDF